MFEVYITILFCVMANTAGIESNAKTISVVANKMITTNSIVKYLLPFICFVNFPPASSFVMGKIF